MGSSEQLVANVEARISGMKLSRFQSVRISQFMDNHHSFNLVLSAEMFSGDKSTVIKIEDLANKIVGENVTISLKQGELDKTSNAVAEKQKAVFNGLISSFRLVKDDANVETIILSGVSPTVLLCAGSHTRSFTGKTLAAIVNDVLKPFTGKFEFTVNPSFAEPIDYIVQYNENNLNFLYRLAEKYGEWVFYTGEKFLFGKSAFRTTDPIKLVNNTNLFNFDFNLRIEPFNFKAVSYDYLSDETFKADSKSSTVGGLGSFMSIGMGKSEKVFDDSLTDIVFQNNPNQTSLTKDVKMKKSVSTSGLAILTGRSPEMTLTLGNRIKVTDPIRRTDDPRIGPILKDTIDYGSFVITSLYHSVETGSYQSSFEASPVDSDFPPVDYATIQPNAEPQAAVVMRVNDDKSMGRVKVQFPWQKDDNEMSPWIRVVNLMAGKEQGVYFIPEVGEVVFVDFEFGNPDIPFVTGSMYHGQVLPGNKLFNDQNNIKGIITKGGNHIIIDDTGGSEKIHIYNKDNQNEIELSLADKHIKVKSEGTIFLEAAKSIEMKAPKIKMEASEELNVKAGKTQMKNDQSMEISAGSSVDIKASASGTFKASASLDLEGGGAASLKGAMVKIN